MQPAIADAKIAKSENGITEHPQEKNLEPQNTHKRKLTFEERNNHDKNFGPTK